MLTVCYNIRTGHRESVYSPLKATQPTKLVAECSLIQSGCHNIAALKSVLFNLKSEAPLNEAKNIADM